MSKRKKEEERGLKPPVVDGMEEKREMRKFGQGRPFG